MSTHATNTTAILALTLALLTCACGKSAANVSVQGSSAASTSSPSSAAESAGSAVDFAKLDADVEQLEKRAERNPGDDEALSELAKAYVRRGDARRAANQLREALFDYRRAQSAD